MLTKRLIRQLTGLGWLILLSSACSNEGTQLHTHATEPPSSLPTEPSILPGDSTPAIERPELRISAEPEQLNVHWDKLPAQTNSRLLIYDTRTHEEHILIQSDSPLTNHFPLQSETHLRAWDHQQLRLELCSADECVSSLRKNLDGLASTTLQRFTPAVYLEGERYGEQFSVNRDASLAVITLPTEGALELYVRVDDQWTLTQRHKLTGLLHAPDRHITIGLSDNGDTIAVMISSDTNRTRHELVILERLGESWVEVNTWLINEPNATSTDAGLDGSLLFTSSVTLSTDGNTLLLQTPTALRFYQRESMSWSQAHAITDTSNTGTGHVRESAASRDLSRVFTLSASNELFHLDIWRQEDAMNLWQKMAHFAISGFDNNSDIHINSNVTGDAILIAGWEQSSTQVRTPIMEQYTITQQIDSTTDNKTVTLDALGLLRSPPSDQESASLVFTASDTLQVVAIGWQGHEESLPNQNDASLSTYVWEPSTAQWLSSLALPKQLPTLATQTFANKALLSGDGNTLLLGVQTKTSGVSHTDQVLVFR